MALVVNGELAGDVADLSNLHYCALVSSVFGPAGLASPGLGLRLAPLSRRRVGLRYCGRTGR